jgi:hypothetical protein
MQTEQRKLQHYRDLGITNIVPFVVESTGRLGPRATEYLNQVLLESPRVLRSFRRDLSFVLSSFLGQMICDCRLCLQV